MTTDKVATLIGFAMRAGKVVFGTDNIETCRKKYLIVFDGTLSQNSQDKLVRNAGNVPTLRSTMALIKDITHREGCKALALTDKQMAQAILTNKNGSYQQVTEVKN